MLNKQEITEFLNAYMQANISFFVSGYQLMKTVPSAALTPGIHAGDRWNQRSTI